MTIYEDFCLFYSKWLLDLDLGERLKCSSPNLFCYQCPSFCIKIREV